MSLKECIKKFFALNSDYLHADQAFNQAASLQTLSDDLYTDPFRFIYELVQNADDASSTHLQISLIEKTYLIVSHDGKAFSEKDIRSLCAVNNSTKTRNSQMAGYKGLGFKAVFGKSNYVLIITKGESFRFDGNYSFPWTWKDIDQTTWEHDNDRKFIYPWQICPIWTENHEIPDCIRKWLSKKDNNMSVKIIIRLYDIEAAQHALKELASQPHTALFLRHIRRIDFFELPITSNIAIAKKSDGLISLSYNRNQRSEWLVSRREVVVPSEVLDDKRLPDKLRHALSVEIGLAAKLDVGSRRKFISISNQDSVLFAYMPTKISAYNLPLLVNANFLTNANREQIHVDSIWNQWLFKCIPRVTMEWIIELTKQPAWRNTAYDLLPNLTHNRDKLANEYNDSCSRDLTNMKFIINRHREYLTLNEAIIDLTDLSNQQFIGTESMRRFILHEYKPSPTHLSLHPFISDNPRLRELLIRTFTWNNAIDMLMTKEFQENFSVRRDIELISYLFDHKDDEEISKLLYRIPFIMDRKKHLQIPHKVYFPSQYNDANWYTSDCQERYVHDDIMNTVQPHVHQGLEQLGVTVKTDLTFFHRTIIPNASTFITPDNALSTVKRLCYLYMNGQIIPDDLQKLGQLCLFTKAGDLAPANQLYLSFIYQPFLPLDINTQLSTKPQFFVSPLYAEIAPSSRLKEFFLLLGIQQNIGLIALNDNYKFFKNYHEDQIKIIYGLNSQQIHRYEYRHNIQFLEFTEDNFCFSNFFWHYVLQTIPVTYLNRPEKAFWGVQNRSGAIHGTEVYTYPQWFVHTRPCIPVQILLSNGTSQATCLRARDVFHPSLKPLIGRYLPIFEYVTNVDASNDEWQKFFKFKTELSVDDHFLILEQIYLRNQGEFDIEDDRRIQNIYASLLKFLSKDVNQRQLFREKFQSKKIYLSNERYGFLPPEELNVWLIDTFPPAPELQLLKLDVKNRHHTNLPDLLYVFNVNRIENKDLSLKPINETLCDEWPNRLQKTYFSLLFDHHRIKNKKQLDILDNIKFFEADRLEVYINSPNIFVGAPLVYETNNCLYVTKPCNVDHLSHKICELLSLPINLFKTHVLTMLTTTSMEEYFIQLGISSGNDNSTNDQFMKMIKQDNLKLFKKLPASRESYTPADLLIACLEAQDSKWSGYIYHYTHLENAVSILRDKTLKSRHLNQTGNFKDSSSYDHMSQIYDQVNHYVRFYFRPLTLTQSYNENLGCQQSKKRNNYLPMCPVPIFFCINLREVLQIPNLSWKISLSDMSNNQTEYGCSLDIIKQFDFLGLFNGIDIERGKRSSQLEFLIENQLNFQDLSNDAIKLIYQNRDAKHSLETILNEDLTPIYLSEIKPDHFFGKNSRIYINHDDQQDYITVTIDGKTHHTNEKVIVQIKSKADDDEIDLACTNNTSAVFHYNHITTIYGKDKEFKVYVGKQTYSVYYQYENQEWLIYTNHNNSQFDQKHLEQHPDFIPYD